MTFHSLPSAEALRGVRQVRVPLASSMALRDADQVQASLGARDADVEHPAELVLGLRRGKPLEIVVDRIRTPAAAADGSEQQSLRRAFASAGDWRRRTEACARARE